MKNTKGKKMEEKKGKKDLHIQMFSIHGLVRAENMEMGRDADTGGQIKYVVELGNHLSMLEGVRQVDLFTRLIDDKTVSKDYAKQVEQVNERFRIVRVQCGGRKYIRKELLWPHLAEYVDKVIKFIKQEGDIPDLVHGHYADAGYVAKELSEIFGIPFVFTGHSLGRSKHQKLINDGMKEADIVKKFKIDTRIEAEEEVLKNADLIVTSTNQEIEKQYGAYENHGIPDYRVIPPGIDIEKFYPYYHDMLADSQKEEEKIHAHASVLQEMNRFFLKPDKPIILALSRPDKRKNISGLIRAYGEDLELQAIANLAIFAGIRKNIDDKEENERQVLTDILLLMDKYDLYGKMAVPKKHDFEMEVPELYRIAAEKRGVFVNPALTEPFGLTLLEAAACGIPIVATNDGGPRDIMSNCKNGILIDPTSSKEIKNALRKILTDNDAWETYSKNGIVNVREHYTWEAHAGKYIEAVRKIKSVKSDMDSTEPFTRRNIGKRLAKLNYFIITDIDNTLIGDDNSSLEELLSILKENHDRIGFGIATGRSVESAVEYLEEHSVTGPDVAVTSVGSEIYYEKGRLYDRGWDAHLSHKWNRDKIREVLDDLSFLEYQEEEKQKKHKISYYMEPEKDRIEQVHDILIKNSLRYNLVYSHDQYLDILPYRASKGKAIRYISYKWEIPLENIMVCGDSANDEEMLRGEPLAVIVENHSTELDALRGLRRIYFSKEVCAAGIIDGMKHYGFLDKVSR